MTTHCDERASVRSLLVLGMCAALLAQMALPTLHALETGEVVSPGISIDVGAPAAESAVVRVACPKRTHDPMTCVACRTLLRTNPVASAPVACGGYAPEHVAAVPAESGCASPSLAQTGHPPRAPPADARHLA